MKPRLTNHLKKKRTKHTKQGDQYNTTRSKNETTIQRTIGGRTDWNKTQAVNELTNSELTKIKHRHYYSKDLLKDPNAEWPNIQEHAIAEYETTRGTIKWKKLADDNKSARVS